MNRKALNNNKTFTLRGQTAPIRVTSKTDVDMRWPLRHHVATFLQRCSVQSGSGGEGQVGCSGFMDARGGRGRGLGLRDKGATEKVTIQVK